MSKAIADGVKAATDGTTCASRAVHQIRTNLTQGDELHLAFVRIAHDPISVRHFLRVVQKAIER